MGHTVYAKEKNICLLIYAQQNSFFLCMKIFIEKDIFKCWIWNWKSSYISYYIYLYSLDWASQAVDPLAHLYPQQQQRW